MRWVTYLGLVLRRVWARRWMLLGSFLGATLVIALLAVLPLYEASISGIDLLFTLREAPDTTVDLSAVLSMTEYTAEQADAGREAIAEAAAPLRTWFPTSVERTLSREVVLIPIDYPDWLGLAAAWREAGALPEATPWPQTPPEPMQAQFFTAPDLGERLEVVTGAWPPVDDPSRVAEPMLKVLVGEKLADVNDWAPGDRVILQAFASQASWFEIAEVSGIARPADPESVVWDGVDPNWLIFLSPESFDAWLGTFGADPDADPWQRAERGFHRLGASRTTTLHLDREAV
ncbi:MAG: hypothetical protein H6Q11_481, partial [Acidobacteria bacterium]|nr:hypothetical protein [Acidobacteriota bacterium]